MKNMSRKLIASALAAGLATTFVAPAHAGTLSSTGKGIWDAAFLGTVGFGNYALGKVGSSNNRVVAPTDSLMLNLLFQNLLVLAVINAAIFGIGTAAAGIQR